MLSSSGGEQKHGQRLGVFRVETTCKVKGETWERRDLFTTVRYKYELEFRLIIRLTLYLTYYEEFEVLVALASSYCSTTGSLKCCQLFFKISFVLQVLNISEFVNLINLNLENRVWFGQSPYSYILGAGEKCRP